MTAPRLFLSIVGASLGCNDIFQLNQVQQKSNDGDTTAEGGADTTTSLTAKGGGGTQDSVGGHGGLGGAGGAGGSGAQGGAGLQGGSGGEGTFKVLDADGAENNICAVVSTPNGDQRIQCFGAQSPILAVATSQDIGDSPGELPVVLPIQGATPAVVRVGDRHACTLTTNQKVRCWGDASLGRLGGSSLSADMDFGGLSIEKLSVGGNFACALSTNKKLFCWGDNSHGQASGTGKSTPLTDPMEIVLPGGEIPIEIATGYNHACVVENTGNIRCWGNNDVYQCGTPQVGDIQVSAPISLTNLPLKELHARYHHTCGITLANEVQCWGANLHGQLGAEDPADEIAVPTVALLGPFAASGVTTGTHNTCAFVLQNGQNVAKCWGQGAFGQRGTETYDGAGENPDTMGPTLDPVKVPSSTKVVRVIGGWSRTCVLFDNGQFTCFGDNKGGALGIGISPSQNASWGNEPGQMGNALKFVSFGD